MRPFQIAIPPKDLDDLRRRLAETRWPPAGPGTDWERGVPLEYLRELTQYWQAGYDWRAAERWLNSFPQFIEEIDGVDVHFVHVRSAEPDATPIILTHGWPGSFVEFLDIVGPLTDPRAHGGDPADAFHVVIPSIPGFGFSSAPTEPGWDVPRVARAWAELMRRLGYDRYLAQGGDWGKVISLRLAEADPDHVAGVHLNMFVAMPPMDDPNAFADLDERDLRKLQKAGRFQQDGMGWQQIQSTRPQTIAYGLSDSPVGQLAWVVEKFKEWSGADKGPEDAVNRDRMLTDVTIYWLTNTSGPSAQLYFESTRFPEDFMRTWAGPWPLSVPVGIAVFPDEVCPPIRKFAEPLLPTLTHWTEFDRGGHFAALQQGDLLVTDLRAFNRALPAA
ncbi:epoxide hydrolase family protein [Dactylosporangium sp. CS-047395]|uniref:epoxide hydrolase family protein n=1 Tax=Dactylosporangium sp. CS-047395 TaxID=3239936 RepID=UPI003D89E637